MTAKVETVKLPSGVAGPRAESRVRLRFRAPFALRCGALLIDYILLALILTLSTMIARLMGGGARMAGGTAEKVGIIVTLIVGLLGLGFLIVTVSPTGRALHDLIAGTIVVRRSGGPMVAPARRPRPQSAQV